LSKFTFVHETKSGRARVIVHVNVKDALLPIENSLKHPTNYSSADPCTDTFVRYVVFIRHRFVAVRQNQYLTRGRSVPGENEANPFEGERVLPDKIVASLSKDRHRYSHFELHRKPLRWARTS